MDLSIICPTYKRQNLMLRSSNFFYGKDFKVIYIDGSDSESDLMKNKDKNIEYYHIRGSYKERIKFGISKVKTKYISIIGDDDFFDVDGIEKCLDFLDNNDEYVSCSGTCIHFLKKNKTLLFNPLLRNLLDNLKSDNLEERLFEKFSNYETSHFYAITRTDIYKKSFDFIESLNFDFFGMEEYLHQFILLTNGRCKVLPNLFFLRSAEDIPNFWNRSNSSQIISFDYWWKDPDETFYFEKNKLCNNLQSFLEDKISLKTIHDVFETFLEFHNKRYKKKHPLLKHKFLNPYKKLISRDKKIKIYSFIKSFQSIIKYPKNNYLNKVDFKKLLLSKKIKFNENEFNKFVNSVEYQT